MEKSRAVMSGKQKAIMAIIWLLMAILAIVTVFPVVYIVLGSFKSNVELLVGGSNIFPTSWHFENYVQAWTGAKFATYTGNSILISVGVMLISLFISTMAGYVFSRSHFRGKNLIYGIFTAFMFINVGSVSIRPLFELATAVHLTNNLLPIILISVGTGQATYIFLSRGFVDSVPRELDEAAKIDGCTFFQTFIKIILPVLKPVMGTIALLSFRQGWNEYIMPLVFTMSRDNLRPLTVGVNMLKATGGGAAAWNVMFAGASIAVVPMIIIYIIFNKNFMSGSTAGAVKG
ncbi:MAG: carbohydrate ABC transporter permease [Spirochaetes bacterium]|uniref:Carbohydrate ABC transporter permease n=1 Tax=Candidatus Ornithospirochaeta stercoripullorum TaxID=2840899 RepID=A0A9D9H503_9SPIO|nr:carbohydrate ABC transporter permease [Candidatus Ornithospirochaeta stercoripullorum]